MPLSLTIPGQFHLHVFEFQLYVLFYQKLAASFSSSQATSSLHVTFDPALSRMGQSPFTQVTEHDSAAQKHPFP